MEIIKDKFKMLALKSPSVAQNSMLNTLSCAHNVRAVATGTLNSVCESDIIESITIFDEFKYCCPTKVCRDILLRSFIGQPCFVSEFIAY